MVCEYLDGKTLNPRRWVIWPFLAPKEVRFASSEWDPLWSHGRGGRDKEIPHFFLVNGNPLQRILWLGTQLLRPYREKRQNRAAAAGAAWLRLPPPRAVQRDRGGSSTCFGAVCATQRPPHPAKPPKTWFSRPPPKPDWVPDSTSASWHQNRQLAPPHPGSPTSRSPDPTSAPDTRPSYDLAPFSAP